MSPLGILAAQTLTAGELARIEDWFRPYDGANRRRAVGHCHRHHGWQGPLEHEPAAGADSRFHRQGLHRRDSPALAREEEHAFPPASLAGGADSATGRWQGGWQLELGGDPTLERSGRAGPTLRALAQQLRARGIGVLEGPLVLTSRTGPASSSYPTVWSTDFAGQLYAPPVGPVTLHENTISLNLRPGRDVGSPPSFIWAYPAGVDRLVRMSATTVGGSRRRLALIANNEGGWTLAGTIGIDSRVAGISAVAHDPVSVLGYAWSAALENAGIRWINRTAPPTIWPALPSVLAKVESAPFDSVAVEINRSSLNIGAELVLQWATASQTAGPALVTQHVRDVVGPSGPGASG